MIVTAIQLGRPSPPTQMTMIGASATSGIVCETTSHGITPRETIGSSRSPIASSTPRALPSTRP